MLIEFRVRNFRSIRDEIVLSAVASHDDSLPGNVCQHGTGGLSLLRSLVIYGPNASGKSNLVRAIEVFAQIVVGTTDSENPVSLREVVPFALAKGEKAAPTEFEMTFNHLGSRYQYGFSANQTRILGEWLYEFPKEYPRCLFRREWIEFANEEKWFFGPSLRGEKKKLAGRTRPNVPFLWAAAQWNHEQLMVPHEWLNTNLRVLRPGAFIQDVTSRILDQLASDPTVHQQVTDLVLELVRKADPSIVGVEIVEKPEQEESPSGLPMYATMGFFKNLFTNYNVLVSHEYDDGTAVTFALSEESDGTQRLFELAGPLVATLAGSYTVAIDELERSLHPLLLRALVEQFHGDDSGADCEAQLIFTTHDTTILDPALLRRDQIWFIEKSRRGESQLYSLSDYKEHRARKGEAIQKGYLSGRYGAIPVFERFEEA